MGKPLIIAVANQKGGVGKTTIATQLAFDLALRRDKKVLFIDMDAQGNASSMLTEEITGQQAPELFNPDLVELVPQKSKFDNLDVIPTEINSMLSYALETLGDESIALPKENFSKIKGEYDVVVVDCPPNLGTKLRACLTMATHVLCPIRLCGFAVDGLSGLIDTIATIQEFNNPGLLILGVLVNAFDKSAVQQKTMAEIQAQMKGIVMESYIRNRTPMDTANTYGIPIWEVPSAYRATEDLNRVFAEIYKKSGLKVKGLAKKKRKTKSKTKEEDK